jgi:hypothetical protein
MTDFNTMKEEDIPRTKEGRTFWRELANSGMRSALGEYTPYEFEILLDYIEELEEKIKQQEEA